MHDICIPPTPVLTANQIWQGKLTPSVGLVAIVVSDPGLASSEPQWSNASVNGCILIGLQPRGGWQVMQRTVQWGQDSLASIFGVTCSNPHLYAYFACSIRNRLELWDSEAWDSPMEGQREGAAWKDVGRSNVKRPSKLIDGSRGGQAFVCDLLRPRDGALYPIVEQAKMQFRSLLLVSAGLMKIDSLRTIESVMEEDFQLSDKLGVIFRPLLVGVLLVDLLVLALAVGCFYALFHRNIFGSGVPFVIQACSLLMWAVGAIGLLALGGHPRVKVITTTLPDHVAQRLAALEADIPQNDTESGNEKDKVKDKDKEAEKAKTVVVKDTDKYHVNRGVQLNFGSIHGSVYTPDHGHCTLPIDVVRKIASWDIELTRTHTWGVLFVWWGLTLLVSIALQITGSQVATVESEIFSVLVLLLTALTRGYGVAGPETWLIPLWKRREGAQYGAVLVGKMESRISA